MSLTSFLAEKDVKAKFREVFPLPRIRLEPRAVIEPLTTHYSLIGTAFDYLLRFHLQRFHPHAVAKYWIAEAAAIGRYSAIVALYDEEVAEQAQQIVEEAKMEHAQYLQSGILTDALLRSALLLAQIDPFFRAGKLYEPFGEIDDRDVEDLRHLLALVPTFASQSVCLVNPTFGASHLVGGADVDLVLDGCIIDIKTTKFLQLKRDYIDQLLGYYALYRLDGITGMPNNHMITDLGIYFSRHGYLYAFPVSQFVQEPAFSDFLRWFQQRAEESYGMST